MQLTEDSYKLRFEKISAIALGSASLWFGFGDVAHGYGFFSDIFGALKLGLCILSGVICVRTFAKGILGPSILCALVVVIYNPFVSLAFDYNSWKAVNLATAAGFVWVFWRMHRVSRLMTPQQVRKMQMAEARAVAINDAIAKGEFDEEELLGYMRKLTGGVDGHDARSPSPIPSEDSKTSATNKEEVIHFVIKGPPPGVPRTDKNTLITGAALRIVEPDGTRKSTLKFYSGTDPLTIVEAGSAIYWRDQVENGFLTDQQAIEGLQAIQQHTLQNYIMLGSMNLHPGEVAITTGLTQLSLHYAIIYLDRLNLPDSTVRWMAQQHAKGPSFERVNDYKKAESLKAALAHADVAPEFLIHLKASVTGTKILEFEQRATQENELSQEHIRKQTHLCFEGSPLRDLLKEYVDRSPHLTARNDHNNCLNVLAPILDFGYRDGAVVPSLSKYTTDTCVFELACYILASADFWAFNNAPDKRPHIQQILFSQLDALTSRSGFLPEEASFDYANSRLGVYGRIAATNFSVEGFHLRLKQALAYAANNSKPPVNLDDVAPIFGDPIEGLALTRALVDWDIDRMTGMDSTLSLIC